MAVREELDAIMNAVYRSSEAPQVLFMTPFNAHLFEWLAPFAGRNWRRIKRETRKACKAFVEPLSEPVERFDNPSTEANPLK